jgi:hypothetical protein
MTYQDFFLLLISAARLTAPKFTEIHRIASKAQKQQ